MSNGQNDCFMTLFKYPKISNMIELVNVAENVRRGVDEKAKGKNFPIEYLVKGFPKEEPKPKASMVNFFKGHQNPVNKKNGTIEGNMPLIPKNPLMLQQTKQETNNNNNNIISGGNEFSNAPTDAPTQKKGILSSVGGIFKGIKNKFKQEENIEGIKISSTQDCINIFEKIYIKYGGKMNRQDAYEYESAVAYFKATSNLK